MARSRRRKLPQDPVAATIESLSHDGKGVAHIEGKATFIHGALPQEEVMFRYTKKQKSHDEGMTVEVLKASPDRVAPPCQHFDLCGGCSMQHLSVSNQLASKQDALMEAFRRIGKVEPAEILPPLSTGVSLGYRRKARLGVKYVFKKGKVLVGFRERGSGFLADLSSCKVLHPKVGELLTDLGELIFQTSIKERIPQIEVAMGDTECVLIFRILEPLSQQDEKLLLAFSGEKQVAIYIQEAGPDSVRPLGDTVQLSYALPAHQLKMAFLPNDFTQVNSELNRLMIDRAIEMLNLDPADRVLDLFCGLGNFTLPLAKRCAEVVGVEGDGALVQRARNNAESNKIENSRYYTANLYESLEREPWLSERFDKVLLDPPRSGAQEVLAHLPKLGADRIVYVSCYPGTLARDAGILVNELGYKLVSAGVMDMFPHTSHVESIALFEKK